MYLDALDAAHAHTDRLGALADATEAAHDSLMADALDAFASNADAPLRTPSRFCGTLPQSTPAWDVFIDQLCNDRESVRSILAALNHACQCADPAIRLPAQAVLVKVARAYADAYADTVAEG